MEEKDAPGKIDRQLQQVDLDCVGALLAPGRQDDPGDPDTHKGVEDGPNDGKHQRRRRKRRLDHLGLIELHAVPGQEARQRPYRLCDCDPKYIGQDSFPFQFLSPEHSVCSPRAKHSPGGRDFSAQPPGEWKHPTLSDGIYCRQISDSA